MFDNCLHKVQSLTFVECFMFVLKEVENPSFLKDEKAWLNDDFCFVLFDF